MYEACQNTRHIHLEIVTITIRGALEGLSTTKTRPNDQRCLGECPENHEMQKIVQKILPIPKHPSDEILLTRNISGTVLYVRDTSFYFILWRTGRGTSREHITSVLCVP